MKLDNDCIRDILLVVEDNDKSEFPIYSIEYDRLKKYKPEAIRYHVEYCIEEKLFSSVFEDVLNTIEVKTLSEEGHKTIQLIRDDAKWNKIKNTLLQNGKSIAYALVLEIAKGTFR